jgi:hypothetical protein
MKNSKPSFRVLRKHSGEGRVDPKLLRKAVKKVIEERKKNGASYGCPTKQGRECYGR